MTGLLADDIPEQVVDTATLGRTSSTNMNEIQLTYTQRLPDKIQSDVLRYLSVSMVNTNEAIGRLWSRLDEFIDGSGPAWKQVTGMISPLENHGCRQWRCEAEAAGRILRSQASRKQTFQKIFPLLSKGLIVEDGKKKRPQIHFRWDRVIERTVGRGCRENRLHAEFGGASLQLLP